jgi:hypothetical protein
MSSAVELARQQWAEGHRQLQAVRSDVRHYQAMLSQVNAVTDELRRRIGSVYDLDELVASYHDADSWLREELADALPGSESSPDASVAADAAFYLYARGARDYEP